MTTLLNASPDSISTLTMTSSDEVGLFGEIDGIPIETPPELKTKSASLLPLTP